MGRGIRKQGAASIFAGGFFRFAVYACVVCAVIYVGKSAYDFGYAIFDQIPVDDEDHGEDVTVVIKDGASVYQIGKILKSKGLIKDAKVFVVQESLSNYKDKLQSGTYILNTSMTTDEMLAVLAREDMTGQPEQDSTDSLDKGNTPFLTQLEKDAKENYVPIIRREMQSFLKVMLQIASPHLILEVGTAVGFSTLLMSEYAPKDCRITTIENYEKRIPIARENFKKAGKEEQITLLEGDAAQILKTLEGSYDFIFMDAAKAQYINFFPDVLRLLKKGGILISDNVLQDGDIIESHFAVERRNRTIYKRMREYLYVLKNHEELETSIIPLGDGVTLSIKK